MVNIDVLSNRKMLQLLLKKKGLDGDQAAHGQEAVELMRQHGLEHYDIIFMDSVMPVMTGPEAAKTLRSLGYQKLIVGVTGNAMDVDIVDFETAGADIVLTKPLRLEMLTKVLEYARLFGCVSSKHVTLLSSELSTSSKVIIIVFILPI